MKFKYYLRGAGIGIMVSTVILSVAFLFQDNMSDAEVIQRAMELGMVMEENTGGNGTLADMPKTDASVADNEAQADGQAGPSSAQDGQGQNGKQDSDSKMPDSGSEDGQSSASDPENGQTQDTPSSKSDTGDNDATGQDTAADNHGSEKNTDQKTTDGKPDKNKQDEKEPGENSPDDGESDNPDSGKAANSEPADEPGTDSKDSVQIVVAAGDVSRIVSDKVRDAGLVENADEFNDFLGVHGYANLLQPGTYEIEKGSTFKQIADILTTRQ